MAMNDKAMAGLKRYGKGKKTKDIAADLEGKEGVDDPDALAVWIRKKALGEKGFEQHVRSARAKKGK